MAKKETTLDVLARLMREEFGKVHEKLGQAATRQEVNERFDAVDNEFQAVHDHLNRIETRLKSYGYRIENLERDVEQLKA